MIPYTKQYIREGWCGSLDRSVIPYITKQYIHAGWWRDFWKCGPIGKWWRKEAVTKSSGDEWKWWRQWLHDCCMGLVLERMWLQPAMMLGSTIGGSLMWSTECAKSLLLPVDLRWLVVPSTLRAPLAQPSWPVFAATWKKQTGYFLSFCLKRGEYMGLSSNCVFNLEMQKFMIDKQHKFWGTNFSDAQTIKIQSPETL